MDKLTWHRPNDQAVWRPCWESDSVLGNGQMIYFLVGLAFCGLALHPSLSGLINISSGHVVLTDEPTQ